MRYKTLVIYRDKIVYGSSRFCNDDYIVVPQKVPKTIKEYKDGSFMVFTVGPEEAKHIIVPETSPMFNYGDVFNESMERPDLNDFHLQMSSIAIKYFKASQLK